MYDNEQESLIFIFHFYFFQSNKFLLITNNLNSFEY